MCIRDSDPVVRSAWTPDAPISREQAEAFDRDGYLLLENLFDDDEVTLSLIHI